MSKLRILLVLSTVIGAYVALLNLTAIAGHANAWLGFATLWVTAIPTTYGWLAALRWANH